MCAFADDLMICGNNETKVQENVGAETEEKEHENKHQQNKSHVNR